MPRHRTLNSFAIYGFVTWTSTNVLLVAIMCWAIIPDSTLARLGITYFPDKYWALALSAFANISFIFVLLLGVCWNLFQTPDMHSLKTVCDLYTKEPVDTDEGCVPVLFDIPLAEVNSAVGMRYNAT